MMLLHAKEDIDGTPGDEAKNMHKVIDAGAKVIDTIELSYSSGDFDLGRNIHPRFCWS